MTGRCSRWRITVNGIPEVVCDEVGRISLRAVIELRARSLFDGLQHTVQFVDNITWRRDNHFVRAGVERDHFSACAWDLMVDRMLTNHL